MMPSSGPPVDGTSAMDNLSSLLRQLVPDRKDEQIGVRATRNCDVKTMDV